MGTIPDVRKIINKHSKCRKSSLLKRGDFLYYYMPDKSISAYNIVIKIHDSSLRGWRK
jgi:hypothetical protein